MPSTKTKRQDGWGASLMGWAGHWFGGKTASGTTIQPPGAAARGSGAFEGRNPYDYVLPGYAGFNGDPTAFGGIPGIGGIRWPGTYSTYRIMMAHPTVALTRASVFAPVLAGSWFYESHAEDENEDACELVQKTFEKIRQRILGDALRSLDFGFQAFELTWDKDRDGYSVPTAKPLLPELTTIVVDDNGNVTGIKNGDVTLKVGEFLLINYDVEGSNHYGRSRLENIRRVWANYLAIEDKAFQLDSKAAGIIPLIYFPADTRLPGTNDPNSGGTDQSNFAVARRIASDVREGRGVAVENFAGQADGTPEQAAALADKSDWKIETVDIGNAGPSQSAILEKLKYYDQMLVRGYLRSERTVIEANTAGSRADAESHSAGISDTDTDLVHASIVEQINRQVVDEMLALNFGEAARGTVWISPREVVDERRATMSLLLQSALSDPMLRGELFERIDKDSLFQWAGVKMMEDARPWGDMPSVEEQKDNSIEHAAKMAEATGGNEKVGE